MSGGTDRQELLLHSFVERMAEEHPPLSLDHADFTARNPAEVRSRYGLVFDYLTRVELEVERNVLEIGALLPRTNETDELFYKHVWHSQEYMHGVILDELLRVLGLRTPSVNLQSVGPKIRLAGWLSRLPGVHDVLRLIYYLTGAATERSAIEAYTRLHKGLLDMGEMALAETVIAPIRRQEPGHFAFYRKSAEKLVRDDELQPWQLRLARVLRSRTFGAVGVNDESQRAQFGAVAMTLGMDRQLQRIAGHIGRVEADLLWARGQGMAVPPYIVQSLKDAIDAGEALAVHEVA